MARSPRVVIIAGINGAGKTTAAPRLLAEFGIGTYLNADAIARELASNPRDAAIQAGRIMHGQLEELRKAGADFAFETTLSGLSLRRTLSRLHVSYLLYLWLPSVGMAVERVAGRVRMGGHAIPDEDVFRRYLRSVSNFERVYRRSVSAWRVYHGSRGFGGRDGLLISEKEEGRPEVIHDLDAWSELQEQAQRGEKS